MRSPGSRRDLFCDACLQQQLWFVCVCVYGAKTFVKRAPFGKRTRPRQRQVSAIGLNLVENWCDIRGIGTNGYGAKRRSLGSRAGHTALYQHKIRRARSKLLNALPWQPLIYYMPARKCSSIVERKYNRLRMRAKGGYGEKCTPPAAA